MTLPAVALVFLSLPAILAHGNGKHSFPFHITQDARGCTKVIYDFNPLIHKTHYKVGVYASEGDQVARQMYGKVFEDYLSATAGQHFDPPIHFELISEASLTKLMNMANDQELDFLFSSSAVFSCMATEWKAQPLVTIINRRQSRGYGYDLDVYGGVMFTLPNQTGINSIQDFKGRSIGAGAITAMGGGQTQFYEMVQHGLSFVADPKQVIFTGDERLVVQGLLDGDFEIGFARTDQIERHVDAETGEPLRDDAFKIINPQTHVLDDGTLFPFVSSTGLHPEWPVAALDHVDKGVAQQVQEALFALGDHAMALELDSNQTLRCETTLELAELANTAATNGAFTGFRTARSYFEVRTKQETAGFLRKDNKGSSDGGYLHCIRGDTLYQDIQCPDHHYKVTEEQFHNSCQLAGLECKDGYECYCQPCVKAFEVDVYQYRNDTDQEQQQPQEQQQEHKSQGCDKMSLCGTAQQTKMMTFRAFDNLERENAYVEVILHLSDRDIVLDVTNVLPYTYQFQWAGDQVGVGIMEIFVDGVQIPESPLRVQVVERQCDSDFESRGMVADGDGNCVCPDKTYRIGDKCVDVAVFAITGSILGVFVIAVATCLYMKRKSRKNDELWQVHADELSFDDPVEVIGQGAYGVVLLAEYRGTKVAIKRALKEKKAGSSSSKGVSSWQKRMSLAASSGARFTRKSMGGTVSLSSDLPANEPDTSEDSPPPPPETIDIEAPEDVSQKHDTVSSPVNSPGNSGSGGGSSRHFSVAFLTREIGATKSKYFPWLSKKNKNPYKSFHESILGSVSHSTSRVTLGRVLCPWFSESARKREEFKTEMRVLSRLRHPCITTVMGAVIAPHHDPVMVMEYMEYGSLHDLLQNETMYLSGEIILQITRNLAQGLRFLHSSKPPILHGDLKARNILVDSRFRAKLCDFGLATKQANSISGTPFWLAPEYLLGISKYTAACDIYSVGIILYEIYSRKRPYAGEDYREVMRGVCNRRVNKRPAIPSVTPPKFVDMMKKCWSPDVHYRPQARHLDLLLMEMNDLDAEPLKEEQQGDNRKRAGDLLYDIFPKHVADALKQGQKVEPEKHEMVTVIFSDIIKFTEMSRWLGPEKVCDMLDRLYIAFDACARKHQVFKVETIGDAWMGVTNLENDQDYNHVKHIAEFAVDMVNEANQILVDKDDPTRGYVNIRVGFHSGAVVSNVIGSLNKRYCLFGDTVNTASRMEANSAANRILCSERSYRLLKEQAPGIKTKGGGKISVKGKGDMYVYWVGDNLLKEKRRANNGSCGGGCGPTNKPFQEKTVGFVMDEPSERDMTGRHSDDEGFQSAEQDAKTLQKQLGDDEAE